MLHDTLYIIHNTCCCFMKLRLPKTIDWWLYILPIILICVGLVTIYSLTYYSVDVHLFYDQLIYALIGIGLMIFFSLIDYRHLRGLAPYIYIIGLVLLGLVLVLGKTSYGATRWINLGFFDLQVSELFKLLLIIVLAVYLAPKIANLKFRQIIASVIIMLIGAGLVLVQPDLGSAAILVFITLVLIFSARPKKIQTIIIIALIVIAIPTTWYQLHNYQKERISTFLNPGNDPLGAGYSVTQSTITVGSGGLWGRGFGHGPQSQLNFLPVAHTDFIFAGIAEATGFIGSIALILIFLILVIKIINIARVSKDSFGTLLAIGIATVIFVQMFINIGMNIGIMPVTGIPLPFVSYGGSSLIVMMMAIGILQSIYIRHKKISF